MADKMKISGQHLASAGDEDNLPTPFALQDLRGNQGLRDEKEEPC
ncbi:MAG: hypothetical protein ABFR97_11240 [Thermodesulfobacteriota bacterium]